MTVIDLNSDVGESFGNWSMGDDAAIFRSVSSANVACGFHAGDPSVMAQTCRDAVDADPLPVAVDGARASGMTEMQVLTRVELPLAAPLVIGGIRSAFLQVIATATLAAYVGSGGLGRYLFLGLKTQDYPQMLAGSILVIALAALGDLAFAGLQRLATPAGLRAAHR